MLTRYDVTTREVWIWPITSVSQFGPRPLLVEPDMTAGTGPPMSLDPKVGG
jgi:hypothetical protein